MIRMSENAFTNQRRIAAARSVVMPLIVCLLLALAPAGDARATAKADFVLVRKSERKLYLFREGRVLREFPISLGLSPDGAKQKEGDFRTPEGRYILDQRNLDSDFFLSIRISYPNEQDLERARAAGVNPGSLIMIHGLPDELKRPASYYESRDWTDGCIAVSNAAMVEIWLLTGPDTPIEILP